jgi:hypothetical protein
VRTGLPDETTLALWERAQELPEAQRVLALAGAAGPPATEAELERLPLGRREARLLELHRSLGGPALDATAVCPSCGETVEFEAEVAALLARADAAVAPAPVELDGFRVEWRSPDSGDLEAAARSADPAAAERVLLERCVLAASGPDGAVETWTLPGYVRHALSDAMAGADPLAEVLVELDCPECGRAFVADVPVARFAWERLRTAADRLLREVDALARAYGWTEPDALALGPRRRAAYLRLVREEA